MTFADPAFRLRFISGSANQQLSGFGLDGKIPCVFVICRESGFEPALSASHHS